MRFSLVSHFHPRCCDLVAAAALLDRLILWETIEEQGSAPGCLSLSSGWKLLEPRLRSSRGFLHGQLSVMNKCLHGKGLQSHLLGRFLCRNVSNRLVDRQPSVTQVRVGRKLKQISFVPSAISVPPKPMFRCDNRCSEKTYSVWQFASVVIKETCTTNVGPEVLHVAETAGCANVVARSWLSGRCCERVEFVTVSVEIQSE